MSKVENPAAFPLAVDKSFQFANEGMSLRDWLAGQALIACGDVYAGRSDDTHARRAVLFREHANKIYAIADAMLAARAKGGQQ